MKKNLLFLTIIISLMYGSSQSMPPNGQKSSVEATGKTQVSAAAIASVSKYPNHLAMANREVNMIIARFTEIFKTISKKELEIFKTIDQVDTPHVRIQKSDWAPMLCNVPEIIKKHQELAGSIVIKIINSNYSPSYALADIIWKEDCYNDVPFMMPYNGVTSLWDKIESEVKQYAIPTSHLLEKILVQEIEENNKAKLRACASSASAAVGSKQSAEQVDVKTKK